MAHDRHGRPEEGTERPEVVRAVQEEIARGGFSDEHCGDVFKELLRSSTEFINDIATGAPASGKARRQVQVV